MVVTLRQGLVPCLQLYVDLLPPLINHPCIIGNEVTAGGAGVAIAMIVEPLDRLSRATFIVDKLRVLFCLTLGQTGGGLHVEPCPSDQIPGQDLLWHVRDHDLFDEPGFALGDAPRPEIRRERHRLGRLFERGPECGEKGIGLWYDVEGEFLILEIPRRPRCPGDPLVVPGPVHSLEIIVPEPLDARRKVLRLLNGITWCAGCSVHRASSLGANRPGSRRHISVMVAAVMPMLRPAIAAIHSPHRL